MPSDTAAMSSAISLRDLVTADCERLATLANDWSIAQHTSDGFPHPYTGEFAEGFVRDQAKLRSEGKPATRAIVGSDDVLIGCCGI